jgi:multidrug efflux pump subunit AcrA (membrane-fusion protein)
MKRIVNKKKMVVIGISLLCVIAIAVSLAVVFITKKDAAVEVKQRTYTVAAGNIVTEISAAGNLALSKTEDIAVDLFYPAGTKGTIGEVMVDVGDTVTKGQVLVTVDKNEWNDQLAALATAIVTKERALVQAQINLKNAQQTVTSANQTITSRETAVISAKINLLQAQDTMNAAITTIDFTTLAAALNKARSRYDYVSVTLVAAGTMKQSDWELAMQNVQEDLDIAQAAYDDALAGYTGEEVTLKKMQYTVAESNFAAAQQAVIDAKADVTLKEMSLTLSQGNLDDAEQALEDARTSLTEAQSMSAEIIAPFDGFVTQVNVAGGDEVLGGTVVVQIADPDKFEVNMSVSEEDISNIQLNGKAYITVDALDITLPATVTYIAPTATISSGVVNYSVTVEVESIADYAAELSKSFNDNRTAPSGSIDTGNMTMPAFSGNGTMPQMSGQTLVSSLENIKLKAGMTVTAELIISEADDVLLVPYTAVTSQGPQKYVQVLKDDGTTEKRTITTGITDYTNYEVSSGLTAGEKIVLPSSSATTSTTSTTTQTQQNSNIMFPGMGGGTPPSGGGAPPGGG